MKEMDREQAKKYHRQRITKLMSTTRVDNETAFDVLDEGTTHLMDHFKPPKKKAAEFDHVLIIGSAYLGEALEDPNIKVRASTFFATGNMHELSHTIADVMHEDKAFAHAIFHAIEVFALHERRKPDGME